MEHARVVLVTNVGQGFGRAVALSYGQAGYDVVCADTDVDLASKTAAEVEELGAQAIPVQADVSEQLDVRAAFGKVHEIFGALSGVVHVAIQHSHTPFGRLTESEFAELLREDVISTFLVLREATRHLAPSWVVVVTPPRAPDQPQMAAVHGAVSSMAAAFTAGGPGARLDLLDLADLVAPEPLATRGPRVNVVVPSRPPSDPRHDARLAHAVRYLGSAASVGVSGTTLAVELPPPPRVTETLLPEVRAALDDTMRQDDRASGRDDPEADDSAYADDGWAADDDLDQELEDELVGRRRPGIGGGSAELDGEAGPKDDRAEDDDPLVLESEGLDEAGIGASVRALAELERREGYGHDLTPSAPSRRGRNGS